MSKVINFVEFANKEIAQDIFKKYRDNLEPFGSIDFEKVIAIPNSMNIPNDNRALSALNVFFSSINPKTEDMGIEKMEEKRYENLKSTIQKKRGTIPILDNLPFETVIHISQDFFNNAVDDEFKCDNAFELGKAVVDNILGYGTLSKGAYMSRYWGTISKAFDTKEQDYFSSTTMFSTIIFPPVEIYKELSKFYPKKEIRVSLHRPDDKQFYCAEMIFLNGERTSYQEFGKNSYEGKLILEKIEL